MCEYFDYTVVALKRIRIVNISLDVPVGKYREITKAELDELYRLIGDSTKTEEGSLPKPANKPDKIATPSDSRSEEHTSELQSRPHLVCRLLLEKKKRKQM